MNFNFILKTLQNVYLSSLKFLALFVLKSINYLKQKGIIKSVNYSYKDFGYYRFRKEEMDKSFQTFKKHFYKSVFLHSSQIRRFAISEATKDEKENDYFLEFGVFKGASLNFFSKYIKQNTIYGFDSFEGINYNWSGHTEEIGHKDLKKKLPKVNSNVILIPGWIEETLDKFISERKNISIKFIHIDTDTYESTNHILKKVKPYLQNNCIILFDELYNYAGWSVGEYKALIENFKENEYEFFAFSLEGKQAAMKYKKL